MPGWVESLLNTYGYAAIFLVVFLNNVGIPMPGDTFLLGAGFFAAEEMFHLPTTIVVATSACFLGGNLGYWIGRGFGRKILFRFRFLRMTPEKTSQVERFLRRHGAKAVFFARFVALVHPVTGLLAGIGRVGLRPFLAYNLLGAIAYAFAYTLPGYFFGASWEMLNMWLGRTAIYSLAFLLTMVLATLLLRRPVALALERFSRRRW